MDRRIKYTKKVIEDTFLSLLEKKDISKISITEICEIADVNRATFYRYYLDINDLLKKIEEEFAYELKTSDPLENLSDQSVFSFTKGILSILKKNKKLVRILFNTNHNLYFLNDVLEIAYDKCIEKWELDLEIEDQDEVTYAVIFVFNGALGIINYWVKEDFNEDVEELAKRIEKLTIYGAKKFVHNKGNV